MTFSNRISGLKPSAIREIFKVLSDPEVISFAAGSPSPELFPAEEMSVCAQALFAHDAAQALQYGITEGYAPLREQTRRRLSDKYGIGRDFDDLMILSGGQQGMDLTAKVLLNEGDAVLCEEPSFIGSLNCFRSYGARLVGIPMDGDGMNMDALEAALKDTPNVKLIYTIPTFQNPSGQTLSLAKRKQMLALAEQYGVMIAEDNPYFELRYSGEPLPTLKSMDATGRVIYVGSYSKVISPGMRVGFVLAEASVISKMAVGKQVSDVHTNQFFQMLVSRYLDQYDFDAHIEDCRMLYRTRRDQMVERLRALMPRLSFIVPDGGLFLWCSLPEGLDSMELARRASAHKVAIVPGSSFLTDERAVTSSFRLNFSLPDASKIDEGCAKLALAVTEVLG